MTPTVTAPSRSIALRLSVLAAAALLAGPVLSQTPATPAATPAAAAAPAPAVAGPFTQAPLPYAEDALEPVIDTQTMQLHWGKHHRAYYDALNRAAGNDAEVAKLSLADLQGQISRFPAVVRNNGGGAWNHDFFWQSMAPVGQGGEPSAELLAAIERDLGGMEKFQEAFNAAGTGRFGSGWVWLIEQDGKLAITSTPNQDNPLMDVAETRGTPLLGNDVWEHAYYLKHQNRRADYLKSWWQVVNWNEVNKRFAASLK